MKTSYLFSILSTLTFCFANIVYGMQSNEELNRAIQLRDTYYQHMAQVLFQRAQTYSPQNFQNSARDFQRIILQMHTDHMNHCTPFIKQAVEQRMTESLSSAEQENIDSTWRPNRSDISDERIKYLIQAHLEYTQKREIKKYNLESRNRAHQFVYDTLHSIYQTKPELFVSYPELTVGHTITVYPVIPERPSHDQA